MYVEMERWSIQTFLKISQIPKENFPVAKVGTFPGLFWTDKALENGGGIMWEPDNLVTISQTVFCFITFPFLKEFNIFSRSANPGFLKQGNV